MLDCAPSVPPTVVADDQRVGTRRDGELRVLDILDALQNQLAAPAPLDPFDVAPVEFRVELLGSPL